MAARAGAKSAAAKKTTAKKTTTAKAKKTKAKAKPKPKKKAKKAVAKKPVLTLKQKEAHQIKDLKKIALSPPTGLPTTRWLVFFTRQSKGSTGTPVSVRAAEIKTAYSQLGESELEVRLLQFLI